MKKLEKKIKKITFDTTLEEVDQDSTIKIQDRLRKFIMLYIDDYRMRCKKNSLALGYFYPMSMYELSQLFGVRPDKLIKEVSNIYYSEENKLYGTTKKLKDLTKDNKHRICERYLDNYCKNCPLYAEMYLRPDDNNACIGVCLCDINFDEEIQVVEGDYSNDNRQDN